MDVRDSIQKLTGFALRLGHHLSPGAASRSNVALSPLSLHAVLGLIAAGSRGATREQVLSVIGAGGLEELNSISSQIVDVVLTDGSSSGGPRLASANGVWVDRSMPLKPGFKEIVTSVYKAEAKDVDFQNKAAEVANEVNLWVENVTAELIKDILPPGSVNGNTRLVFSNAIYFKGAWDKKFNASLTKDSEFYLHDGSSIKVPFMTSKDKQYISVHDGFKVLRLPYKQGDDKRQFSMYIFLPDARDGYSNLSEKLTSDFTSIDRYLPVQKVEVGKFKIPRYKISYGLEASDVLKGMGMVLPFTSDGDLTEMVDSPLGGALCVSSIFHKAFIEVNEEGTEAAAASAAVVMLRSFMMSDPLDFEADHPFIFIIREDITGVILFTGHVVNPV